MYDYEAEHARRLDGCLPALLRTALAACARGEDVEGSKGVCMRVGACIGESTVAERICLLSLLDRNWKGDHRIVLGIVSDSSG